MQNNKDDQPEGHVHQPLQGQIPAHTATGVVHRLCHQVEMSVPAELNEAVAQIFPFQKHEKSENHDQNDRNHHAQQAADRIQPALTAPDLPHRDRAGRRGPQSRLSPMSPVAGKCRAQIAKLLA